MDSYESHNNDSEEQILVDHEMESYMISLIDEEDQEDFLEELKNDLPKSVEIGVLAYAVTMGLVAITIHDIAQKYEKARLDEAYEILLDKAKKFIAEVEKFSKENDTLTENHKERLQIIKQNISYSFKKRSLSNRELEDLLEKEKQDFNEIVEDMSNSEIDKNTTDQTVGVI